MKKRNTIIILSFLFCLPFFYGQNNEGLLKTAENNTAFYGVDFYGDYSIVFEKPGEARNVIDAKMYRRDSSSKWTILITGPKKDKGKGYLQFDSNVWFYDPADKTFTFTQSRDRFQNTTANTSDFVPQKFTENYNIEAASDVKLGAYDCVLFELKAKTKNVDYPIVRLWVSKNDGLIRKKEDYSLSGQKLRTMVVPKYQFVTKTGSSVQVPVPASMVLQDNLRGKKINGKMEYEKTLISIFNVGFSNLEDSIYTKPYLEMMGAK